MSYSSSVDAWETVIGLEVHAQLKTASKLFCSCPTTFGAKPNSQVCEVCSGMPGALPRLNARAVELAVVTGLALNSQINAVSIFSRKNYFYPDLPNGFQTSQIAPPVCTGGYLDLPAKSEGEEPRRVRIHHLHMEDDAGKCVHGQGFGSMVDLNRAGTPLVEIVTEPDMRSAEEASEFLRRLRATLVYLGVTDGNMEEGSFRCDVNVSVRRRGADALGVRAEVKNLNSFRFVEQAVACEVERQIHAIENGVPLTQETRLFDPQKQITASMRSKEEAPDYRYFPNPDLPPVLVDAALLAKVKAEMPELPEARRERLSGQYGIAAEDAVLLTQSREVADFAEAALKLHPNAKRVVSLLLGEFLPACAEKGLSPKGAPMSPVRLVEVARCVDENKISLRTAHELFPEIFAGTDGVEELARSRNLLQVSDLSALEGIVDGLIQAHPKEAAEFMGGKDKVMSFFVGQVMRQTKGSANPNMVAEILQKIREKKS